MRQPLTRLALCESSDAPVTMPVSIVVSNWEYNGGERMQNSDNASWGMDVLLNMTPNAEALVKYQHL